MPPMRPRPAQMTPLLAGKPEEYAPCRFATEGIMSFLSQVSFDDIVASLLVCLILRETFVLVLPDHVAGPGGWLVDTGEEEA